ncbi:MAG: SPASM domain-containing protein, partial [Deltaproteobacteria bacterium]
PFKSGAGSYNTIMKNIKETWDLVKIGIGGNFERANYKKFVGLLDNLAKEDLTPDRIPMVKFDPVVRGPEEDTSPTVYKGGCTSINEPWMGKAATFLREEILKRGYNTLKIIPITCMVEKADSYVVNFDGVIYKCPAFIGKRGFEVGDVRAGVMDHASSYKVGIWKNEECVECEYLPLCFGGCRYMSFIRDGNLDTVDCQKAYLDASLETLINQDIRYRLKADSR